MTPLVDATARLTVLVLVVLVADVFLRRRSAAARHAVLAGALLAGAAVVPMSWLEISSDPPELPVSYI